MDFDKQKKRQFSVRWEPNFREAWRALPGRIQIGFPLWGDSDLARRVLTEWMLCQYGLAESKARGLVGPDSESLPRPEHLINAIRKYEAASLAPTTLELRGTISEADQELPRLRTVQDKSSGSPAHHKKAKSRA